MTHSGRHVLLFPLITFVTDAIIVAAVGVAIVTAIVFGNSDVKGSSSSEIFNIFGIITNHYVLYHD